MGGWDTSGKEGEINWRKREVCVCVGGGGG